MATQNRPGLNGEQEKIKKKLFDLAMKRKWSKVVSVYEKESQAHSLTITNKRNTALHVAVADGKEKEVEDMVKWLNEKGTTKKALEMKNVDGNTPLHLAAAVGSVRMCVSIGKAEPSLVEIRNNDGETPFFMAAACGETEAFLRLHSLRNTGEPDYTNNCRRKDGETILHCAIDGEYLELAFQIIHLYKKLVTSNNKIGLSPLHYLAMRPSLFRSGVHIRTLNKIIYHCTTVNELIVRDLLPTLTTASKDPHTNCPATYKTCYEFSRLVTKSVRGVISNIKKHHSDPENPGTDRQSVEKNPLVPDNYVTCFDIAKVVAKGMLIILGLGSREVSKMKHKKEKHTWSIQIMKLLLDTSSGEYQSTGEDPREETENKEEDSPYFFKEGEPHGEVSKMKQKQKWPIQIMKQLLDNISEKYESTGEDQREETEKKEKEKKKEDSPYFLQEGQPPDEGKPENKAKVKKKTETAFLLAAKNGVTEIMKEVFKRFPVAISDTNDEKKNAVLLAVENRQPQAYKFLLDQDFLEKLVFRKVDAEGNSALHLASKLVDQNSLWMIPGAAFQMQWEIKWYEYIRDSKPEHYFPRHNKDGESPREIFIKTHAGLLNSGGEWLTKTSQSCSVVAALVATVAFATAATVPGGNDQTRGTPLLGNQPIFDVFAIGSLFALGFSITSLVMFLAILTSRYEEEDFRTGLPWKLLLGLTSLFLSIGAMLVSFCAGHFFVLKDNLKYAAFPIYALTCLPLSFFAAAQFPLYLDLIRATFMEVPLRSYTRKNTATKDSDKDKDRDKVSAKETTKPSTNRSSYL